MRRFRNIGVLVIAFIALFPPLCTAASLLITWKANTDADLAGYKVYYGTQSGTYGTVADVQKATSYSINNVQSGLTYYVTVASYDNSGNESSKSTEQSAYIPVIVPATDTTAPTGSVVINSGAATSDDQCGNAHAELQRRRRNSDRDEDQQRRGELRQ